MSWVIIEVEGRRHRIAVARDGRGVWVAWPDGSALIEPPDSVAGETARREGDVQAPLTGKVVKVEVRAGDTVEADQLLVVLEAMKMEYRLTSPRVGLVTAVGCAEGDLVDQGMTLVELAE